MLRPQDQIIISLLVSDLGSILASASQKLASCTQKITVYMTLNNIHNNLDTDAHVCVVLVAHLKL